MIADEARDWANIARDRRLELGLTQAEVTNALGKSRQWLVNFESGASAPVARLDTVLALLEVLKLTPDLSRDDQ
ncbi:helix-turn-helix transcriptional regulator [Subtercola endophyticus]|uniref:helix-turn-helix transcriptional regulator n=1 Tax=Subtercola endophyticus TaxID=2895559 RepID=UPI001E65137E|nr:helix-turn-helix domain-containing protein [Subtercola endophyticus]UFS58563.1 helix-turn-helix domain-containing protein [Subtercola endophyticus]